MTGKIHIAGEPKDGVQRCVRCRTILADERTMRMRNGGPATFWPIGPLYAHGYWGCGVTPFSRVKQYRECGKAGK